MTQIHLFPPPTYIDYCTEHAKEYAFCRFCGKEFKRVKGVGRFCKVGCRWRYKEWEVQK